MLDDILTVQQVARRWHCDDEVVYRLVRQGKLKHFRLSAGGRSGIRIHAASVLEYEGASYKQPPSRRAPPPVTVRSRPTAARSDGPARGLRHLHRA
jgi:excisionase family DNA binding protein